MSPTKSFIRNIHLYLGLASGLVVVFACLTGSILAFEKEIEQAWYPERYFVLPAATPPLPLARLTEAAHASQPNTKLVGLKIYADPGRTVELSLTEAPAPARGPGPNPSKADVGSLRLYLNPYTAAITGEVNPRATFFHTVEQLHRGLVAGKTGKLVMGVSASIFLFILGTGLVLWWPATRKALRQRLQVKWGSTRKRLTHDFHVVLGFYAALFLFVIALTGVGMSFDWVGQGINKLTNSPLKRPEPPGSTVVAGAVPFAADAILALARQQAPGAVSYTLQLPKDAAGSIRVAALPANAITENATNEVFLDQYSGQVIGGQPYAQRPVGQRIRGLFKPVHTGAIFGWPTKTLALVFSLLGATFPITGTVMWLNRRRKNRRKQRQLQAV